MRPEVIDLGIKLALHLATEDILIATIRLVKPDESEAEFLEGCILK